MSLIKKSSIAIALGSALGLGMAAPASADVYGVSYLDIDNFLIDFTNNTVPGAGLFTFGSNQDAILNGNPDVSSGAANCFGVFPSPGTCSVGTPTLSGAVQNAPPNAAATSRGEGDYTVFGQNGNFSNSEAEVVRATLTGSLTGTEVTSISESNLATSGSAQANTNVDSNTNLNLMFPGGVGGELIISFDADINIKTEATVTGGEMGIAQANSGATFLLQADGVTLASWAPNGQGSVLCGAGLTCTVNDDPFSLNNTRSSVGAPNSLIDSGSFKLTINGLTDSPNYSIAVATTTSTNLTRVPVPGTALLIGTGLLLGARATRRKKK